MNTGTPTQTEHNFIAKKFTRKGWINISQHAQSWLLFYIHVIFQIMTSNPGYGLTVVIMCAYIIKQWPCEHSTKTECIERSFEKKNERNKNTLICELFKYNKNKRSWCGSSDNFTCVHNEAQVCWLHFFTLQAFCVFLPLTQFSHHPFACCIPILCLIDLLVVCSYVPCIVSSKLVCVLTQQIYSLILLPLW